MTRDTLTLLNDLLAQVQLPVGHVEFEREALRLIAAKRELAEALSSSQETA